jgi:hypothetical protein
MPPQPSRSAQGQGRDCLACFGKDRLKILKPPWRTKDREKTATAEFDPIASWAKRQLFWRFGRALPKTLRLSSGCERGLDRMSFAKCCHQVAI